MHYNISRMILTHILLLVFPKIPPRKMQQQQQFHPSFVHHHHYHQRVQENMGNYYRNYSFPPADQTLFLYPVQPVYYVREFAPPSPLQYYYNHPNQPMYYHGNDNNYHVNRPENLERRRELQESDQRRSINLQLSFAPEEDTAIIDLDGEFVNADGDLVRFSTSIPVVDAIVGLQELEWAQEDMDGDNKLSEATISEHLKTKNYQTDANQVPEICVVCQCEYENEEIIGSLECGHEYHAVCIKRWLMEKNVCPVCKRTGIQQES